MNNKNHNIRKKGRDKMEITFIGTSACIPDIGSEVASLAVFPHSFLAMEGKTLEI